MQKFDVVLVELLNLKDLNKLVDKLYNNSDTQITKPLKSSVSAVSSNIVSVIPPVICVGCESNSSCGSKAQE